MTSLLLILKEMAIYKSKFTGAQVDQILSQVSSKQDALTPGYGIDISDNVISVSLNFSLYEIVSTLPTENINNDKIYLKASSVSGTQNKYTEYIYANGDWEILGEFTTDIDLSGYATKEELSTINNKVQTNTSDITQAKSDIKGLSDKITPITDDIDYEVVLFKKA